MQRGARKLYAEVLKSDPKNRYALEAMGYIAREENDNAAAERYFNQLASDYPDDYVPYLALGDLYTATAIDRANDSYEQAFKRAPHNRGRDRQCSQRRDPGGAHSLAAAWVGRATGSMLDDPRVMRERERVLFHRASTPSRRNWAIRCCRSWRMTATPRSIWRTTSITLDAMTKRSRSPSVTRQLLPKEAKFPAAHRSCAQAEPASAASGRGLHRAIERDPKMVEGYVNRGYVLNDLQNPDAAIQDFHTALDLQPSNGVAHLGMSFL